jgi:hypothetical protein
MRHIQICCVCLTGGERGKVSFNFSVTEPRNQI